MSWSELLDYAPEVISTAGSIFSGLNQAGDERAAADKGAQTARLGFDYLQQSPVGTQYLPAGGAANNALAALLGLSGSYSPAGSASGGSATGAMTPGMLAASQVGNTRNPDHSNTVASVLTGKRGGEFLGNVFGANNASAIQDIAAALSRGEQVSDASWRKAGYGPGGSALGGTPQAPGSASGAAPGAMNGQAGYENAFNNYRNSTGYQFRLGEGQRAITGSNAAKGLLDSGDTARSLVEFGQDYGSAEFNNYLQQLMALSGQGLQAGQTIGQAGSNAGAVGANAITQGYGTAAGTSADAYSNAFGGVSDILNKYRQGQTAPVTPLPGINPTAGDLNYLYSLAGRR
jgi:hypothetical protein